MNALGGFDLVIASVDRILLEHGVDGRLFSEQERAVIRRGRRRQLVWKEGNGRAVGAQVRDLIEQAAEIQDGTGCAGFADAVLRFLVGAKLDLIMGDKRIEHHGASVADRSTERNADFQIERVAIHVTTHPGEALIRKTLVNLKEGLRPLIVTLGEGVAGALYLLKGTEGADRVDVLDVAQFLTANIYERSLFSAGECKVTLRAILERYNEIVVECETDPTLRIVLG